MDKLEKLIDAIEDDLKTSSMLGSYQLGIALKCMEDRLWAMDSSLAQRCNDIQHKIIFEED